METLIKFVRINTPFILSISTLLNTLYVLVGVVELPIIYLFANITGSSIIVDIYLLCTSRHMCFYYKMNIICLIIIHILGLFYSSFNINEVLYIYSVLVLSIIGIISFLVFKKKYKVCCKD